MEFSGTYAPEVNSQRQRRRRPLALTFDHQGNTTPAKGQVWSQSQQSHNQQPVHQQQPSRKGRNEELEGQHPDFIIPEQGEEGHEEMMHKIAQRNKQLALGKITQGYKNYIASIRNEERELGNDMHVITPRATWDISKRKFDGYLRQWRRDLHGWDNDQSNSEASEAVSGEGASLVSSEQAISAQESSFMSHGESYYPDLPPLVAMDEAVNNFSHMEITETYEPYEVSLIQTPNLTPISTFEPIPEDFTEKDIEVCVFFVYSFFIINMIDLTGMLERCSKAN